MLDLHQLTTPALAYLGDCVLEMQVRRYLVCELGYTTSAHLNKAALDFVCAPKQAEAMDKIQPYLTPDELATYKRGRNMGHSNTPKSATVGQYRRATGMEVLFGYLHVTGQVERITTLFRWGYGMDTPPALPDSADKDVKDVPDAQVAQEETHDPNLS